ncbi:MULTISPECIES: bifunctional glycosyltransferase/CDP-glycerol:glycerophosphate glycerophosphotransferase [Streptomyces]|uniref:Glycosyltransferase n=1 Tax=Streptomyces solicathayae TaxID=3081768 RepID=A0ABZ0LPY5_9ACTN|nr:glycosyltransferase [Streptomyces sp. HUAS YS2]WOX21511.1 glycosyltransferase [Streptomyces sp. HUAS YS2]
MSFPPDISQYLVTVVVPAYNASATLARALQSALAQTHRNVEILVVDDCSADGTLITARQFAAQDARVRVIERPQNSGGCGAPRNNGIEAASGQYVMFLDADDELPLKAVEELLSSALTTGSDVTAGRALRINPVNDEITVWQPQLYAADQTVEGLGALPELFSDPIAAGKLYRRDFLDNFGIRFPEGVFFEDTYFSTVANFYARSFTILATPVYRWMWERESDQPSITNRRHELRSIRDRVLVHQYTDRFLASVGRQDLLAHKGAKFLSHDLRLYTPELRTGDEAYRNGFVRAVAPYLTSLDPQTYELCGPMERVRAFGLIHGRVDIAVSASDFMRRRSVISSDIVERDGRVFWSGSLLGRAGAESFLDVTDLELTGAKLADARLYNEASRVEIDGDRLHIAGAIRNQFGRIDPEGKVELVAVLRRRSTKADHHFPVSGVEIDEHWIRYHASLDLADTLGKADRPGNWNFFVQLRYEGERASTALNISGVDTEDLRYTAEAGTYEVYETVSGNLGLRPQTAEAQAKSFPRGTPWLWWQDREPAAPTFPKDRYAAAIVVHCRNDEYNLREFLASLSAQARFEDIQVVFVDDGSTDTTPQLLSGYAAYYPNTGIVTQNSLGLRSAFDNGLQYVTAPYVMFARARDILGEAAVGRLLAAAHRVKGGVDVVVGEADNFPGPIQSEGEPWRRYFTDSDPIGHLDDAPYLVFSTALGAKLFKTSYVRDRRFRCGPGPGFEDDWFTVPALLRSRRVAVARGARFFARDEELQGSLFDRPWNDPVKTQELVRLTAHVLTAVKDMPERTVRLAQRFVVRSLQPYVRNMHRIMSKPEIAAVFPWLHTIYTQIPDDLILQYAVQPLARLQHHAIVTDNLDLFAEPLSKPDYLPTLFLDDEGVFRKIAGDPVQTQLLRVPKTGAVLETFDWSGDEIEFEGLLVFAATDINEPFTNRVQLVFSDGERETSAPVEQVYRRDRWRTRKDQDWFSGWRARVRLDALDVVANADLRLSIRIHEDDRHHDIPLATRQMLHRFKGVHTRGKDRFVLSIADDETPSVRWVQGFRARRKDKRRRFRWELRNSLPGRPGWRTRLMYWLTYPRLHGRGIWIIGEREDTAQDNSYHLFKWIRQNHPRRKVYYSINGNSADWDKIAQYGHVIDRLSWKHRAYLLHAERLINAYDLEAYLGFPGLNKRAFLRGYGDLLRYKRVFLQHGVVYNDVVASIHAQATNVDMVLTTGRSERAYFAEHCGYGYDRVAATGLPRYDALDPVPGIRRVLVMPTWRRDIVAPSYNKAAKPEIPFAASQYYRFFSALLRNERLLKALEYYGVELEFMPHYEIRPYLKHFKIDHPSITVSTTGRDVQLAMRECSMLVTDYSSVFFDVAYMGKPIVYTNFDDEEFYSKHYKRGYFDLGRDGFGPACATVDHAVHEIIASIERGFQVEPEYQRRAADFFVLRDTSNCERAFQVIETLDPSVVADPDFDDYRGVQIP